MINQNLPLVTIITPTYNRADYLPETIDSVLSQDYHRIEYIVLDDGSLDDTTSILSTYENIIWNSHTNMGEVRTVNEGFRMATGEIIGVVNSDDPLRPNAIRKIVGFMLQHPGVGVVYPDWDIIDPGGNLIKHMETFEYNYLNMLRWHYCIPGPGTLFRKHVVDSLGGRDPQFTYVNDYDFWLRAGLITQFSRIPETLATFRQHPESASSRQRDQGMAEEHVRLIDKIYSLPNLVHEAFDLKREAYSSAYYITGCVCQSCSSSARRNYFFKAFMYCPHKYFGEYGDRLDVIISSSFRLIYMPFRVIWVLFTDPKRFMHGVKKRMSALFPGSAKG